MQHVALVVEDDSALRNIYRLVLNQAGFEVIEAADGAQALQILEEQAPDVVFLDILMPGVNGQSVVAFLHTAPHLSHTHTIIVSSNPRFQQLLDLLPSGQFLHKPIRPTDIQAALTPIINTRV